MVVQYATSSVYSSKLRIYDGVVVTRPYSDLLKKSFLFLVTKIWNKAIPIT